MIDISYTKGAYLHILGVSSNNDSLQPKNAAYNEKRQPLNLLEAAPIPMLPSSGPPRPQSASEGVSSSSSVGARGALAMPCFMRTKTQRAIRGKQKYYGKRKRQPRFLKKTSIVLNPHGLRKMRHNLGNKFSNTQLRRRFA